MKGRYFREASMVALVLLLSAPVLADADPSERERALEERIAELERMVNQLMIERGNQASAEEAVSEIRRDVDAVSERVAAVEEAESTPAAAEIVRGATRFNYGGYIKTDVMSTRYSGGTVGANSLIRDFRIPGLIPVGGDSSTTDVDFHAKETRMNFGFAHDVGDGREVSGFIEMDFLVGPGGNERISNSYNPRVRHAFIRYGNWLAGQYWSTFFNVGALPENLDFIGPTEGTIFARQTQFRYTNGPWELAIENPETTVTPFGGGGRIVTDTANIPDVVARYTVGGDWGNFVVAGIGRQLSIDTSSGTERETGFGLSLSGKINFGRDDLRWMVSGGPGIGRYLGLNTANDVVFDANGDLEAIDAYGGFLAYRHFWNDQWRSTFTFSAFSADNDTDLTGTGVTKEVYSGLANVIYQVNPKLRMGMEYAYSRRENETGLSGNMNRLQFSTIYAF
ncbi:MAG: DcaP family trimeric outer membrane transporter [Pseudomonadota bacterium]